VSNQWLSDPARGVPGGSPSCLPLPKLPMDGTPPGGRGWVKPWLVCCGGCWLSVGSACPPCGLVGGRGPASVCAGGELLAPVGRGRGRVAFTYGNTRATWWVRGLGMGREASGAGV
jgi:hypothetical protein